MMPAAGASSGFRSDLPRYRSALHALASELRPVNGIMIRLTKWRR
jgi:hypothetical protein